MLVEDGVLVEREGRLEPLAAVDSLRVPETVQAVLAARLDRLDEDELSVLQRAAVIGQVFWWGAVADLSPPDEAGRVAGQLQALVRKGLIKPDVRTFAGEDGFRFGHILIRDAAYDSMPKRLRAELHERFADWVERRADRGAQLDEIAGHHLEQAWSLRLELGPAGPEEATLAERAVASLTRAGRRALARDDAHAAASLLGRAAALREDDGALLVDLGEALFGLGQFTEAERVYGAAERSAAAAGDARSEVAARLSSAVIGLYVRAEGGVDDLADQVDRALPAFERAGDDATVARLLTRLATAYWWRCQVAAMEDALERALRHAVRAGDERQRAEISARLGISAVIGPLPAEPAAARVAELLDSAPPESSSRAYLLVSASLLAAMDGDFADARSRYREGLALLEALGRDVGAAAITTWTSAVELLAAEPEEAESQLRSAFERLEAAGELANLASVSAQLAEALERQERHDEALAATEASERSASVDDLHAQIAWRVARVKALVGLLQGAEAMVLANEALELAGRTDSPVFTAEALVARAAALAATGAADESHTAAEEALALYEAKGNRVGAAAVEAVMERRAAARTSSTAG
jgi:tetratricopeptide (TPR) repeat protein